MKIEKFNLLTIEVSHKDSLYTFVSGIEIFSYLYILASLGQSKWTMVK